MHNIKERWTYYEHMVEQGTDEWLELRKGKLTGSNFASILGLNPYQAGIASYQKKQASEKPFTGNMHTRHGNKWESTAIEIYKKHLGGDVTELGFAIPKAFPFIGVSPDGIAEGDDDHWLIEVKCPSLKRGYDKCPPLYMPQVQGNMLFLDLKFADFIVFRPRWHGERVFSYASMPPHDVVEEWTMEVWRVQECVEYQARLIEGLKWYQDVLDSGQKLYGAREAKREGVLKSVNPAQVHLEGIVPEMELLFKIGGDDD